MATARFRIIHHRLDSAGTPGFYSWRLLAINNRDLGRAPMAFFDPGSCRTAVLWLQEHVGDLRVVTARSGPTGWSWRLFAGNTVVAVSSRAYTRRIRAEEAAATTLELIPGAELDDPGRIVQVGRERR